MKKVTRRALPGVLVILLLLCGTGTYPPAAADDPPIPPGYTPDLIVDVISASPEVPVLGDEVSFTVTVRNRGSGTAGTSRMVYYIDDECLGGDVVEPLPASAWTTKTFTWVAKPGQHNFRAVADAENDVAESNETNNDKTFALSVLAPDLVIADITWTPENPSVGTEVDFTVTVKNQGSMRAGTCQVDLRIDGNSRGYHSVVWIDPGDNITMTFSWQAASGVHSIEAVADLLNQVAESDETNNSLTTTYATAAPDLVISSLSWSPQSPTENATVTYTVTIKNQGTGKSNSFFVAYYIDNRQEDLKFVGPLNPATSVTQKFEWTAERLSETIRVIVDPSNHILESDETNNSLTTPLPGMAPDLIVQSITWEPSAPLLTHRMTFTVTVKNKGKSACGYARLSLSLDETHTLYSSLDVLAPGDTTTFTFPWTPLKDSYTVLATIDEEDIVDENDETNNTLTKTLNVSKFKPTADLVVQALSAEPLSPRIAQKVDISVTVRDGGSGGANPSHVDIYVDDVFLESLYVGEISGGETSSISTDWIATAGTHTIRAVADANNAIPETNEENNEKTLSLKTAAPDFVVESATWSPLNPDVGDLASFTVTVKNIGDLEAESTFVSYYIDGVYRGNHYVEELGPGGSVTKTFTWQAQVKPENLRAVVDVAKSIDESDEANNERIVFLPAPDLVIDGITWSPAGPSQDIPVTFSVTVKNIGGGGAAGPFLAYYMDDVELGRAFISHVNAGSIATGTYTWTSQPGEHIFKALIDDNDAITETREDNNSLSVTIDTSAQAAEPSEPEVAEPIEETPPAVSTTPSETSPDEPTVLEVLTEETPSESEETPAEESVTTSNASEEETEPDLSESPDEVPWWQKVLLNRWLIIGVAVAGIGSILVLLRLRRKAK